MEASSLDSNHIYVAPTLMVFALPVSVPFADGVLVKLFTFMLWLEVFVSVTDEGKVIIWAKRLSRIAVGV